MLSKVSPKPYYTTKNQTYIAILCHGGCSSYLNSFNHDTRVLYNPVPKADHSRWENSEGSFVDLVFCVLCSQTRRTQPERLATTKPMELCIVALQHDIIVFSLLQCTNINTTHMHEQSTHHVSLKKCKVTHMHALDIDNSSQHLASIA